MNGIQIIAALVDLFRPDPSVASERVVIRLPNGETYDIDNVVLSRTLNGKMLVLIKAKILR